MQEVVQELLEIGAIKFGTFRLKSGVDSPYYIDLRKAISKPGLIAKMADLMWQKIADVEHQTLCGVPLAALALCTGICMRQMRPMIMVRKEAKDHGTKQLVEGNFEKGDRVIIVEDVITSGGSIIETAKVLREQGMEVTDAVVFLDREQSGIEKLKAQGIRAHFVMNITQLFQLLGKPMPVLPPPKVEKPLSYGERAEGAAHPLTKQLLQLMERKKTNLAASADVSNKQDFLKFIEHVGPYICVLKMHADIIEGFDDAFVQELQAIAKRHDFLIFEDRKFADIGNTVAMQYEGGVHKIASWANIINAHALPGPGLLHALKKVGQPRGAGLLLIPQLSSAGALTDDGYAQKTVQMGAEVKDFVIGFIAQKRLVNDPSLITFTPGVHMAEKGDALGQQYNSPEQAIVRQGSDVIIVGRGLYAAQDPKAEAEKYREAGWNAYQARMNS